MRCEFYTCYTTPINYNNPSFKAKPIKVNWNSEAGQIIEKTLMAYAALTATSLNIKPLTEPNKNAKRDQEGFYIDESQKQYFADLCAKAIYIQSKEALEDVYKSTKDPDIVEKHVQLYKDAYKNKDLLKGGYSDITDQEIDDTIIEGYTISALGLLGKGTLEAAFSLDLVGLKNFCIDTCALVNNISRNNTELLKKKINPTSTIEYRNLEEEVKKDKRKINNLLGEESLTKRKELIEQIEQLKANDKNDLRIKELKSDIQKLYKNCENSKTMREIMSEISEKQKKMKEISDQKVNLSPQEIINKVWTIAGISQSGIYKTNEVDWDSCDDDLYNEIAEKYKDCSDNALLDEEDMENVSDYLILNKRKLNKDIKELIELIKPSTPENEEAWKRRIDKHLFELAGFKYNKTLADLFDLTNCKYLNELIVSVPEFWDVMPTFIEEIANSPYYAEDNVNMKLDTFQHNDATKRMFDYLGIDYYKWTRYNPDSYITDKVTICAEDAKIKAVKNMIHELTSKTLTKNIPKKERENLYSALQRIGVNIDLENQNVTIDGKELEYSDLSKVIAVIKSEFNTNPFWFEENKNEKIDDARDTIYNHFMYQRKQEIDSAKKLKDTEVVDIKVQKVDMSDIKYSLCLGNHSHCCTALGSQANEWTAPLYILSRCISAIEVIANGEPVGNTMMYMAEVNGKLSLVLDNIELQTKFQNNDKIKEMIVNYAKKVCNEVGKPDIPIYAGPGLHKVDMTEYNLIKDVEMVIIGATPENGGVYLDFDCDQHDIGCIIERTDLYRIA